MYHALYAEGGMGLSHIFNNTAAQKTLNEKENMQ